MNILNGFRFRKLTFGETFASIISGIARRLKITTRFSDNLYYNIRSRNIKKKWLIRKNNISYFDINGAKLPDISSCKEKMKTLSLVFEDTFLVPVYYNDNYDKSLVTELDKYMAEGPYGYKDQFFDVTVKSGDIVIDAGAWIGDFSAYAVTKGAEVYAFEPTKDTFDILCEAAKLNENKIYPVKKGLGNKEGTTSIFIDSWSGGNSITMNRSAKSEVIEITSLDRFVEKNNIEKIDFIKADIEGAERELLRGATNILKIFAPKLAICTYHLPDDPEVLEQIIMDANPNYKVVHLKHKLFAMVV